MIVKDFSNWDEYEGNAEGSGRSEKIWLNSTKEIGLFKFPKQSPDGKSITTEHISEKLASDIAKLLNIPCAKVDIGKYNGRLGSMSYRINKNDEFLLEGISFISSIFPDYDIERLYVPSENIYYSLPIVYPIVKTLKVNKEFLQMMMFDALIGNSDRHHSNWAIIVDRDNNIRFSPLYDNGSSLCCYVKETDIDGILGSDKRRFFSLVSTKSKSIIRIDSTRKKLPEHIDVLIELLYNLKYKDFCNPFIEKILDIMSKSKIKDILSEYPDYLLSEKRKVLLFYYLTHKVRIIEKVYFKVKEVN